MVFRKGFGQLNSRLASKGYHSAHRLFHPDDIQYILGGEGFKVKAIRRVEICGDGLRVIIDGYHLVPCIL